MPIFYWIRVANPELIRSMKKSNLPEPEAVDLYHKNIAVKEKYGKRMMIFAVILLIGASIVLLGEGALPNEGYVYLPLLALIFISVFGMISSFNKYGVSAEYIKALKEGYPAMVQCELDTKE